MSAKQSGLLSYALSIPGGGGSVMIDLFADPDLVGQMLGQGAFSRIPASPSAPLTTPEALWVRQYFALTAIGFQGAGNLGLVRLDIGATVLQNSPDGKQLAVLRPVFVNDSPAPGDVVDCIFFFIEQNTVTGG